MIVDGDRMIGRDREFERLRQRIEDGRPGIALVVGNTTSGKGRLLRELRARVSRENCVFVPGDDDVSDEDKPWLTVSRRTTVDSLRAVVRDARAARARAQSGFGTADRRDLIVMLIHGYRPDDAFRRWVESSALATVLDEQVLVLVAATPADATSLEAMADPVVRLGPLPREDVLAELRTIDARISDKLTDQEMQAYASAMADDPSLIGALTSLLPLTSGAMGDDSAAGVGTGCEEGGT